MKIKYTSVNCSLNKFCKNDYLKSMINKLVLHVIFEGYVLANLHIIQLLDKDNEVLPLNQKFFQNVLAPVSMILCQKEMQCKDRGLLCLRKTTRYYNLWDINPGIGFTLIPIWEMVV
jgi:hypothetical protein